MTTEWNLKARIEEPLDGTAEIVLERNGDVFLRKPVPPGVDPQQALEDAIRLVLRLARDRGGEVKLGSRRSRRHS